MARRIHVQHLRPGEPIPLDAAEAHHARDVLRLADGAGVEVFDDAGAVGTGILTFRGIDAFVCVQPADARRQAGSALQLIVAAAVPKGDRADWMVEKLSELGVAELVPLAAARSVVLPEGKGKRDRWLRIATEAAKQSRRAGVMRITELTPLAEALRRATAVDARPARAWYLSTEAEHPVPIARARRDLTAATALTAFIGPEGGWTTREQQQFAAAGALPVRLTSTVLRIETAAVTTAAVVACVAASAEAATLDGPTAADDDRAASDTSSTGTPP